MTARADTENLFAPPRRERGRALALWLFILLLLANAAFFGLMHFARAPANAPAKAYRPLNADKIRLVAAPLPASSPQALASAQAATGAPAAIPAKVAVCLKWGPFAGDALSRAGQSLQKLQLGDRLSRQQSAGPKGYWVYIPPLGSRQKALEKIAELRRLGVSDYLLIQAGGRWQYAISLGVLSTEAAAKAQLAQLRRKGVRSARAGPRSTESSRTSFLIRDADDPLTAKLVELNQDFPGSELTAVPCP
jgi:hypothetical protein